MLSDDIRAIERWLGGNQSKDGVVVLDRASTVAMRAVVLELSRQAEALEEQHALNLNNIVGLGRQAAGR